MDSYQVVIKTGRKTTSAVVADLTPYLTDAVVRWGERGCETLDVTAVVPRQISDTLQQRTAGLFAAFCVNAAVLWSGNVEEITVSGRVVRLRATGAWMALERELYTELWTTSDPSKFEIVDVATTPLFAWSGANRFDYTLGDNALSVWPKQGETYGTTGVTKLGAIGIQVPAGASRRIQSISGTLAINAPAPWFGVIRSYVARDYASGNEVSLLSLAGNGTLQTAAVSLTSLNAFSVYVGMLYNNVDVAYTGVSRAFTAQWTNPVIRTTNSASVTAQEVIRDILTRASPVLVDNAMTAAIGSTAVAINELIFEDETLSQAIRRVEVMGESSGTPWRCWFDETHAARFEKWPNAVGIPDVVVHTNTAQRAWNTRGAATRAYLTYTDANGRTARTTPVADAAYFAELGFQSTAQSGVSTNNSTQLATLGNTLLKASQPLGRQVTSITTSQPRLLNGAVVAGWQLRPGMRCLVNAAHGQAVQFTVGAVEYDIVNRQTSLTAFDPLARLEEQVQVIIDNERPGIIAKPRPVDGRDANLDWSPTDPPPGRERPQPPPRWRDRP